MVKLIATGLLFVMVSALPAPASDPLSSLRFLAGSWNCTYHSGKTHLNYKAVFSYDMDGNWMTERDAWAGGGGDQGMFTYEPKRRSWSAVVLEPDRTTTLFRGTGSPNHVVYRSVYPDASMVELFDRVSPTRYTLHFTQSARGKRVESTDTCKKV